MTDPIADALDEFVPAFRSAEGDWQGVLDAAAPPVRRSWRRHSTRRRLVVAAAVLASLAVATTAVAVGLGGFKGIGAANHPRTGADVIDPETTAYIKTHLYGVELDTARHLGQLPSGNNVYLVSDSLPGAHLCTVVGPPEGEIRCGDPLSQGHPTTFAGVHYDPSGHWVTFGIALDGVTSVSFPYSTSASPAEGGGDIGPGVTVPVNDNLWIYQSHDAFPPTVLQPVTAHFADGTTVTEPATGANCAAC